MYQSRYAFVIDLVHLRFPNDGEAREEFGDLLRGVVLAAALARVRGVHPHEVFVRVAECVDGVVLIVSEAHRADAAEEFRQLGVALLDGRAELAAVHVEFVKESREVVLTGRARRRALDVPKDLLKCLVEALVGLRPCEDVLKELARRDEEAEDLDDVVLLRHRLIIGEGGIVKLCIPRLTLLRVEVVGQFLRDITVEERAEDVLFEVPAVHTAAQVVRDLPDGAVQLCPLYFFLVVHGLSSVCRILYHSPWRKRCPAFMQEHPWRLVFGVSQT